MTPDELLRLEAERFQKDGGSFVVPAGSTTTLLSAPPGGLPPDTVQKSALPTPPTTPNPPRTPWRDPRPAPYTPPPPRASMPVVTTDAVLSSLDHVVWSVSPDANLVFVLGGAVERTLGHPADYLLNRPNGWLHAVPDDDRPALYDAFRQAPLSGSFAVTHRAGTRRVVSRGRFVPATHGVPARVDGTTGELEDTIAERDLRAKLAATEERLRQAEKLETLGRLVAGVAHDFNNCLTVISGNAELVRDLLPRDHALRDQAAEIVGHAAAAATVARQLVAFGRPTPTDHGPIDVNAELHGLDRLLRRLAGDDITFHTLYTPAVSPVPLGAGAFAQVVLNLVANARDAIPGRGTINVWTAEFAVDGTRPGWPATMPPGRYVTVAVNDTGIGISEAVQARMFDSYFTTKGAEGNGVGLATVAAIVRGAGGHIEVRSTEGWSTTVRVFLPPADAPPVEFVPPEPVAATGCETILLVQDRTAVRDLAAVTLHHAGYRVLEADDGATGEERARLYAGPIDLLVTDVGLPMQAGPELAAALRASRPELKVLFVSGSPPPDVAGMSFRAKPYTPDELLVAVRRALDG